MATHTLYYHHIGQISGRLEPEDAATFRVFDFLICQPVGAEDGKNPLLLLLKSLFNVGRNIA